MQLFKPNFQRVVATIFFIVFLLVQVGVVYAATFTPGMAKRNGPGPFSTGVLVQGDRASASQKDTLMIGRGSQIAGNFYTTIDPSQGSIVFWITPEWNGNDGLRHEILSNYAPFLLLKGSNNMLTFYIDTTSGYGDSVNVDVSSWTAGITYSVVARWDLNGLNGSNKASLSVNDVHTYDVSDSRTSRTPDTNTTIGSHPSAFYPANALIEGFTIYRRPLFDGTYGIDVGNGDEIAQIYNSGSGQDPTLVTGSWDVVFALPSDQTAGALATTGQAWTHPHTSNLLYTNTTNTGGFMMNGTYTSDGWAAENGDTQTLTLQPDGTTGIDTNLGRYNDLAATDNNYGASTTVEIDGDSGYTDRALLKFDLSSIPSGASISSDPAPVLTLTASNDYITWGDFSLRLWPILAANANWVEGTKTGTVPELGAVSWTYHSYNTTRWAGDTAADGGIDAGCSVSGTDFDSTPMGTSGNLRNTTQNTPFDITLSADAISNWVNGANYGAVLWQTTYAGGSHFYSSDHATAAYRPKLVVNYTSPPTIAALDTSEKIFAGGYKTTSTAANQGIYYSKVVTAGDDWVIRALGHSDGTCNPKVILYDQTNGAEIGSLAGTTTSTRTDPDVYLFTGEAPAVMTELRVKLINTASSGTCYWHQVEVLPNKLLNPSFEVGSGTPWIPTSFINEGLVEGETLQETSIVHSGSSSFKVNNLSDGYVRQIYQVPNNLLTNNYYTAGGWGYEVADPARIGVTYLTPQDEVGPHSSKYFSLIDSTWRNYSYVGRHDAWTKRLTIGKEPYTTGATAYFDDIYFFTLTPITLTLTPASEANSTENTDELRVDGRDTYVAAAGEAVSIGSSTGYVSFDYRPRHSAADAVKFAETSSADAYVVSLAGDADDFVKVFWDSANTLKLEYSLAGGTGSGTWDATGAVVAGSQYTLALSYTGGASMVLSVDGTPRITLSSIPASFGTAPNTVYFGSDSTGANQGDATFSSLTFDNTAPALSLTALSPDPTTDNTPTVTGTATEGIGTVASVEFQMDGTGGSWTACSADDGTFDEASEAFSCTPSAQSDGSHTIYVRATDSNGNTTSGGSEETDVFSVDVTGPTTPGTASTTSPTSDTTPTWTWTASTDATSGLAATPYTVEWSESSSFASGVSSSTSATNSFTHTTPLTDGTWYFRVKATDGAGNDSSSSSNGAVEINTGAPSGSVSINAGASYVKTTSVTLTLAASSGFFSGTSDIQMKVSNLSDLSDASYEAFAATKDWTLTTGEGSKTVYVQFKDTTGNESGAYSDTIILDSVAPNSFELQNPGGNAYLNSERPHFKWKAAAVPDDTAGLSKYKLEVDNGSEGDFTIDDIPVDRTTTFEALNYYIEYHNFGDSDQTNNSISVTTRSSVAWGINHNDGKLKEGKRTWKVIATDSAGNEKTQEHTIFVDTTSPSVELSQLNDQAATTNNFSTSDSTPTIFGRVTDPLHGDTTSTDEQVKQDNLVSSGPKSVEVQLEKKNADGSYTLDTLTTLNLTETYWASDGTLITDNTQQTANKYSPFEYTPQSALTLGEYRLKIKGIDQTGNSGGEITLYLTITTFQALATTDQQDQLSTLIKKVTTELPSATEEETDKLKQELTDSAEITKTEEQIKSNLFQITQSKLTGLGKSILTSTVGVLSNIANRTSTNFKVLAQNINSSLFKIGTTIATFTNQTARQVAEVYTRTATFSPEIIKSPLFAFGNGVAALSSGIGNQVTGATNTTKEGIANSVFFVGQNANAVSNDLGSVIVKFGYIFITEPTRIYAVNAEVLSATSVKITWQTNHPANGKVNYGLSAGEYSLEQQTDERTNHHEFTLTNLSPNTQYHYEVMSQNQNYVYDANRQFKTL